MTIPFAPRGAIPILIKWLSRRSLRWFYREFRYVGREHVPTSGPALLIGNHPNDLPDVLAGFFTTDRSVRYVATISATMIPLATATYRGLGVIPVMRVRDVRKMRQRGVDVAAVNVQAFESVRAAWRDGEVVGIFPEGGVHDQPELAKPRSGVAKMALDALDSGAINDLAIVPFGLQYDAGQTARSDALVVIGPPESLADWIRHSGGAVGAGRAQRLSGHMHEMLLAVTRNNATRQEAILRDHLTAAVAALTSSHCRDVLDTAARTQRRCAAIAADTALLMPEEGQVDHIVLCRTAGTSIAQAVVRAGGIAASPRDAARVLAAAGVQETSGEPLVAASWPSLTRVLLFALPAVTGLLLHAGPWAAVRVLARRLREVRTDYAANTILPGLHLIFLGYLVIGGLAALGLKACGWSTWWVAPVLVLMPRLGDLAMSWRDAVAALRLRARVRRWAPNERAAVVDAAARLRAAWAAVA